MGVDLVAYHYCKEKEEKKYIDYYQIWSEWRDFDHWPDCLQHFWWKIHDYDSAHECIQNIRTYYPRDTELILFVSWLEKMDTDILFEVSI